MVSGSVYMPFVTARLLCVNLRQAARELVLLLSHRQPLSVDLLEPARQSLAVGLGRAGRCEGATDHPLNGHAEYLHHRRAMHMPTATTRSAHATQWVWV